MSGETNDCGEDYFVMSSDANLKGQVVKIEGDQVYFSGHPLDFTDSNVINFSDGAAAVTLGDVGSGVSITGGTQNGPHLVVRTLVSDGGISITEGGDRRTVHFQVSVPPNEYSTYTAVYYTTQAYVSTNSCQISLTKNLATQVVSGTLDFTEGANFTTSNEQLSLLPASGTPPGAYLPVVGKEFMVGPIIVDTFSYVARLSMSTALNFTLQFLDQSTIRPDVASTSFPAGGLVSRFNLPFIYSTTS